ncbi:hypothetical protein EVC28_073 [Rhizobium phage RHph_I1_23]|nr:hypothetical protein EVC28_073 [Rhizobium phage RHph_I1_23]
MTGEGDFSQLERCRYIRRATTEEGRPGWALFDSEGELELFSENRSVIWFYITEHELVHRWLN